MFLNSSRYASKLTVEHVAAGIPLADQSAARFISSAMQWANVAYTRAAACILTRSVDIIGPEGTVVVYGADAQGAAVLITTDTPATYLVSSRYVGEAPTDPQSAEYQDYHLRRVEYRIHDEPATTPLSGTVVTEGTVSLKDGWLTIAEGVFPDEVEAERYVRAEADERGQSVLELADGPGGEGEGWETLPCAEAVPADGFLSDAELREGVAKRMRNLGRDTARCWVESMAEEDNVLLVGLDAALDEIAREDGL